MSFKPQVTDTQRRSTSSLRQLHRSGLKWSSQSTGGAGCSRKCKRLVYEPHVANPKSGDTHAITDAMGARKVSRPALRSSGVVPLTLAATLVPLVAFAALAITAKEGLERVVDVALAGLCIGFMARVSRIGVYVHPDRLVARGYFTTKVFRWTDVGSFSVGRRFPMPALAFLWTLDGRAVPLWAIQHPRPLLQPGNTQVERLVEQLNAELALRAKPPLA